MILISILIFTASIAPNAALFAPQLTIAQATIAIERLSMFKKNDGTKKKRKLIISIGATDLRTKTPLIMMRKQFVTLFLTCERNGYDPLITTIACYDSPQLHQKANIFNEFLKTQFEKVIDLEMGLHSGLNLLMGNMRIV